MSVIHMLIEADLHVNSSNDDVIVSIRSSLFLCAHSGRWKHAGDRKLSHMMGLHVSLSLSSLFLSLSLLSLSLWSWPADVWQDWSTVLVLQFVILFFMTKSIRESYVKYCGIHTCCILFEFRIFNKKSVGCWNSFATSQVWLNPSIYRLMLQLFMFLFSSADM